MQKNSSFRIFSRVHAKFQKQHKIFPFYFTRTLKANILAIVDESMRDEEEEIFIFIFGGKSVFTFIAGTYTSASSHAFSFTYECRESLKSFFFVKPKILLLLLHSFGVRLRLTHKISLTLSLSLSFTFPFTMCLSTHNNDDYDDDDDDVGVCNCIAFMTFCQIQDFVLHAFRLKFDECMRVRELTHAQSVSFFVNLFSTSGCKTSNDSYESAN